MNEVEVDPAAYERWSVGNVLIGSAFPDLSAVEREILKTGICGPCWDETFKDEEDEDDEDWDGENDWQEPITLDGCPESIDSNPGL